MNVWAASERADGTYVVGNRCQPLLPRWANAAPGKRDGCFSSEHIDGFERNPSRVAQHRDAHDVIMCTGCTYTPRRKSYAIRYVW